MALLKEQTAELSMKALTLVITQTSTLLPLPKSLKIPAHIASTTICMPSSLYTTSKCSYQIKISTKFQHFDIIS